LDRSEVDESGDAFLEEGDATGAASGSGFEEVSAGGDVEDVVNGDADVAVGFAADDDDDLSFWIGGGGENASGVLDGQKLSLKVEDGAVADVLDAGDGEFFDAEDVGERHGGLASTGFDEQVVEVACGFSFGFRGAGVFLLGGDGDAGFGGDGAWVEDEGEVGIAEYGGRNRRRCL